MRMNIEAATGPIAQRRLLLGTSTVALLMSAVPALAQQPTAPEPLSKKDSAPEQQTVTPTSPPASDRAIVVTGIRGSLQRGTEIKRRSAEMVDAISAEDLGKLPDQNIAEGLQRITGIQIERTQGEGNRFQIRGSDQNLTLVNGVEVAPDGDFSAASPSPTRQVNLLNYPSELFSDIIVYKSPSASLVEGGIGGTVDLRMPDPLSSPSRTVVSGQLGFFGLSKKFGGDAIALTSQRFLNGTLGVLLGATYSKHKTVTDTFTGGSYFTTSAIDVTGDGVPDADVALPYNMAYNRQFNDLTRGTVNGVISWRPSPRFKAELTGTYIHSTIDTHRGFIAFNFSKATQTVAGAAMDTHSEADGTTTVLSGEFSNVLVSQDGLAQDETHDIYQGSLAATWNVTDRLDLSGEVAASRSNVHSLLTVYQAYQPSVSAALDLSRDVPGAHITSGGDVTDPSAYRAYVSSVRYNETNPKLVQGRADLGYHFENSALSKLAVGVRATHQTFDDDTLQNRFQNNFPIGQNFALSTLPQYITDFQPDNFFGGADGGYATRWIVPSVNPTMADATAFLHDIGDDRPLQPQPVSNYKIIENTRAAYAQLDWDSHLGAIDFSGNVGARYVKTRQTSNGFAALADGSTIPVSVKNNYNDLLPSLNLKFGLSRHLIARASASKVMSRPPLQDLSPGTTIRFSSGLSMASSGQPLLKPFRAKQVALGLEYYHGQDGMISGAVFYQAISTYVTSTTTAGATLPEFPGQTFFLSQPTNGPGGTNKGVELGVQQSLGLIAPVLRNFGVIANYTYVDSHRKGSSLPIEGTSRHSLNIIGYYENGPFQTRIAYNWRSKQYLGFSRSADTFDSARGQLDASVSYDLRPNLTLTLQGIDLLQSPQIGYADYPSRVNGYQINDRRIYVGIRTHF